jgi:RNA polymerase sigma-70 factor (ECF subfamily)
MKQKESEEADARLISLAQSGDVRSFEILFDRYYAMIHAFSYRVCLVETAADDIAQETFIRAARGLSNFRGAASFKNWLYRIAHHAATDWTRREVRRNRRHEELALVEEMRTQARPANFAHVHAAMLELHPAWREAVALVFFDEMSHAEAALILDCAESTVSWRIFRAKRVLRKLLNPNRKQVHER